MGPEADDKHPETRTVISVSGRTMALDISTNNLSGLRAAPQLSPSMDGLRIARSIDYRKKKR